MEAPKAISNPRFFDRADRYQFFGLFGAFGLAFWFGIKSSLEGRINNEGTVIMSVAPTQTAIMDIDWPVVFSCASC
jgi:hypothetical protein